MSKELIEDEMNTPKITGSPETIWLNYGGLERDDTHENCARNGDVTWCEEAVFVSDVKYVRADRIEELKREHDQLREQVKMLRDAATRAHRKLSAYVGVCTGDKELTNTIIPMLKEALAATEPK